MSPIHVSASLYLTSSARSTSSDSCLSIHMYLRNLCKTHVSGSVCKHAYVSQAPLQDPCLRIRVSTSICISGSSARSMSPIHVSASLYLRVLCKIHVFGFMSQHPYVSCKIHVSGSVNKHSYVSEAPLQDPCLRIRK